MRFSGFFIISGLILASAVLILLGRDWAWIVAIPAVLFLIGVLFKQWHAKASFIRFGSDGVTICYLHREHLIKWSDIRDIRVERCRNLPRAAYETPRIRMVLWFRQLLHPGGLRTVVLSLRDSTVHGITEFALPYTYQMPADKLADLLSEWKLQSDVEQTAT